MRVVMTDVTIKNNCFSIQDLLGIKERKVQQLLNTRYIY